MPQRPVAAFLYAAPIALLGGLIGLGGAEFRLPVLAGALGYPARRAVPLNLLVSLVTIITSLAIYGCDIRTAGTAGLLISLPTVTVGIIRYALRQAYGERQALTGTVLPMGGGSIVGALAGGMLVGIIPPAWLKVLLGVILNVSAWRIFRHARPRPA